MAVPGFQPHLDFQQTPEPRLIDRKTGGALLLTATETQLINAWDRSTSATRLSAAVFMHGLDIDPWQVEQFFHRLERLHCLAVPPPCVPNFVGPRPGVSKLEDKVPSLRRDLLIEKQLRSRSMFHVTDPKSKRVFGLTDSEVSVARMLDGKRQVKEVIENAARLGIEVTLASLQHFLCHLKGYRFIDQDIRDGETTWPARKPWTAEERQLYQASMKMLREGHFAEARSFAESLEAADPTREEARQLKHRVEVEAEGVVELVGTFGELHGTPRSEAVESNGPAVVAVPSAPPPAVPSLLQRVETLGRRHKLPLAGAGLALVLLIALLRPVPVKTVIACELQVETLGLPRTMRGGKVASLDVQPGTRVEKGAVVARLGEGKSPGELAAKVKALEADLAALPAAISGPKTELARKAVKKAQAGVKTGAKAPPPELAAAQQALEALTHEQARAALLAELKKTREEKVVLEAALSKSIVIAPVGGVFVGVGALPDELHVNGTFGQIVGPNFKVVTKDPLPEGIESATFRAGEYEADVGIVEGRPIFPVRAVFVGARGTLELTTGRTPWVASIFR